MAGRGAGQIVVAIACGVLLAAPAVAQDVPLPTPRPKAGSVSGPLSGSASPASAPMPVTAAQSAGASAPKGFFPFSVLPGVGPGAGPAATAFDTRQKALLDKVSAYLTSVQTLVGNFVQIGPDGQRVEGAFSIQKPGKVRFQYNPPSPIDIVADGSSVLVRNRSLETSDYYPLSQTPLRYLLADRIDLLRDTDVVSVSADDTFITVVVEESQVMVGTSRLMMMFDVKTSQLRQWTVTDPQGLDTTVAVYNLDTVKKPDPNLFVINYQNDLK